MRATELSLYLREGDYQLAWRTQEGAERGLHTDSYPLFRDRIDQLLTTANVLEIQAVAAANGKEKSTNLRRESTHWTQESLDDDDTDARTDDSALEAE